MYNMLFPAIYKKSRIVYVLIISLCGIVLCIQDGSLAMEIPLPTVRSATNGVLISRPSPAAEQVRNFIILNNISSPRDYVQWLGANIVYKNDGKKDTWAAPQTTLRRKYGDCEDLAFLHESVLRLLGYNPKVLVLVRFLRNHAICIFEQDGSYVVIDNTILRRTKARSYQELLEYLFTKYKCPSIGEVHREDHNWVVVSRRSTKKVVKE